MPTEFMVDCGPARLQGYGEASDVWSLVSRSLQFNMSLQMKTGGLESSSGSQTKVPSPLPCRLSGNKSSFQPISPISSCQKPTQVRGPGSFHRSSLSLISNSNCIYHSSWREYSIFYYSDIRTCAFHSTCTMYFKLASFSFNSIIVTLVHIPIVLHWFSVTVSELNCSLCLSATPHQSTEARTVSSQHESYHNTLCHSNLLSALGIKS